MDTIDEVMLAFRAGFEADALLAERVSREASRRVSGPDSPRRPVWRRPRILMPSIGAAVAASVIGVALVGGGGNPGPDITARAAAALTPDGKLLAVSSTITVSYVRIDDKGRRTTVPPETVGTIEDLSIAGPGRAFRLRRVWRAPNGEVQSEAALRRDAEGSVTASISWEAADPARPVEGRPGTVTIGFNPDTAALQQPWPLVLSDALRAGNLAEAGKAADGSTRLVGTRIDRQAGSEDDCSSTELLVDPATGVPRVLRMASGCLGNGSSRQTMTVRFTAVSAEPATPSTSARVRFTPRPYRTAFRYASNGLVTEATRGEVRMEATRLR